MGSRPRRAGDLHGELMRIAIAILIAVVALYNPAMAAPRDWPVLQGGDGVPQCARAFELARRAYESEAFFLYEPKPGSPSGFHSRIVLQRNGLDISGGDALDADASVFERIDSPPRRARLYQQRDARDGRRIVVVESAHSWRGDTYGTYVLPSSIDPSSLFLPSDASPRSLQEWNWDPPLVLQDTDTGALWFILTSRHGMADWTVHVVDDDAAQPRCTVQFRPSDESGDRLLPPAVLEFAALVDATLGDGCNEGTLNNTARRRLFTNYVYWNAATRPWVISDNMHNTRVQLDLAMRQWARQTPSFGAAYDAIVAQYPIALDALTAHYTENFELTPEQSRRQAEFVLDVAYRSAYIFPGGGGAGTARRPANPNPWPATAPH
jgi:hypothetical protein